MACPLGSFLKVKLRRIPLIPSHASGHQQKHVVGEEGAQNHWDVVGQGQAQTHSLCLLVVIGSLAFPLAGADHGVSAMGVELAEL